MATASATLASSPGLLEMILLQLPMLEVLLAQRVDRTWNGVIKNSPCLQRALFFRSSSDIPYAHPQSALHPDNRIRDEPIWLPDEDHDWIVDDTTAQSEVGKLNVWPEDQEPILNPVLPYRWPRLLNADPAQRVRPGWEWKRATELPQSSWRRMLPTQPAFIELIVDDGRDGWVRVRKSYGDTPFTLDDLDRFAEARQDLLRQPVRCDYLEILRGMSPLVTRPINTAAELSDAITANESSLRKARLEEMHAQ